ncbi:MAG: hypothetical protein EZS28_007858, partial [Streblomastix strix]
SYISQPGSKLTVVKFQKVPNSSAKGGVANQKDLKWGEQFRNQ